jgi:D-alanyl-lipoteichoic acid acyltransferase DltB (MBOAT superfamily)
LRGKRSAFQRWPRPVRVAATFLLVLVSWVLFRSPNLHEAGN